MEHSYNIPDLVILNAATESNALDKSTYYRRASGFTIGGPAALTGAITVLVSIDGGSTYQTLQSNGSDINIAAGKAISLRHKGWTHMKLKSTVGEGADRAFKVTVNEDLS